MIKEIIQKYNIRISNYNMKTKETGEFIFIENANRISVDDIDFIQKNKPAIIEEIKKMEAEKKIKEEQEIHDEYNTAVMENRILHLEKFFYNGCSIIGLPKLLKSKEKIIEQLNFNMDLDGKQTLNIAINDLLLKITKIENVNTLIDELQNRAEKKIMKNVINKQKKQVNRSYLKHLQLIVKMQKKNATRIL